MKALTIGLILFGLLGIAVVGMCAENKEVSQGAQGSSAASEDVLIQQGPALIAEGNYKRVLDLIEDLPLKARNNIQIRTLECFANLKGWLSVKDQVYKMNWWGLRLKLMYVGDTEATPMLVIFLKDKDPYVRKYAAELLGYIGDERALDDLREVGKNDKNSGVRRYAKWAYKQISGGSPVASGLPPLTAPRVQIPVKMEVVGPIDTSKCISFVNSTSEFKMMFLIAHDYKKYYADFESWADIIIEQLETELQKRGVRVITPAGTAANRVVIGVLNLEEGETTNTRQKQKKALMEKLRLKPLVRIVDIPEYSSLSDLKKNGYEKAERYKNNYQVDMVLHVSQTESVYNFSLIDLYTRKVNEVSMQTETGFIDELTFAKLSNKVLVIQYLNSVVSAKKKASGTKEGQVKPESDYIFNVSVQDAKLIQGAWATRCIVNVLVERDDGIWSHTYEGNNASPASIERAIDGAVYRVVEAIIADRGFRNAISQ